MRIEQVDGLMSQLGPVLDPLGITAFPGAKAWGIALDEETSVLVDFDESQGKLVLSSEVGTPSGDRGQLYELMLRHNYLWDQTGGVRLALDAAGGNVVQIVDLFTEGLDVSALGRAVGVFADAARAWRTIISRPQSNDDPSKMDSTDAGFTLIRI